MFVSTNLDPSARCPRRMMPLTECSAVVWPHHILYNGGCCNEPHIYYVYLLAIATPTAILAYCPIDRRNLILRFVEL